ncbi:MAG TPA: carboxypeptidase-like regulatory domain-containing protein [Acidobacteriaceae bacterium]|nr:carboxypeptidase-like regulatory domain-containing protein [Acidobacteriaceae bacterium]
MLPRRIARAFALAAVSWLVFAGFNLSVHAENRGRKYQPPPPTAAIKVTVLRSTNGKPIPNAAVIFHPIKDGKDSGALELKSDEDGIVKIDVIPIGSTVRLQVIADGWKTYGEDYDIQADKREIVVKMKRPTSQYSLYNNGNQAPSTETTAPKGQSTSAKPSPQTPLPQ